MTDRRIFVHPTAVILGDVTLADGVSIWPNAVLRGDAARIEIGENSNVQDNAVIHVSHGNPTIIGNDTTVGHGAVVNGAKIGSRCIIGMNAVIIDAAEIGDDCIIGAGAVVTGRTVIPPMSVVAGVPGKIIKSDDRTAGEKALKNSQEYQELRDEHLKGRYKQHTY